MSSSKRLRLVPGRRLPRLLRVWRRRRLRFRRCALRVVALALRRLRVLDARQGRSVDVGHALPRRGGGRAGDAFRKRVVAALGVDNHVIAPVALRQDQPALGKRGREGLPAVGALPALMNGVADRLEIGSEASRLLELGAGCRFGFHVLAALVRHSGEAKLLLELAAKVLHLVLVKAGVDSGERRQVDPRPCNVHMRVAVRLMMKRHGARLVVEAKPPFEPVGESQPILARQFFRLEFRQARIGMKKRLLCLRRRRLHLHVNERIANVVRGKAAQFDKLGGLVAVAGRKIGGELYAVRVEITLGDHGRPLGE